MRCEGTPHRSFACERIDEFGSSVKSVKSVTTFDAFDTFDALRDVRALFDTEP